MMEFNTQQILQDAIVAQKYLLKMYCQFGLECSNPTLRNLFAELYQQTSEHDYAIFKVMNDLNYYPTTPAQAKDVSKAIKLHTEMQAELNDIVFAK